MNKTLVFAGECMLSLMILGWLGAETVLLFFWILFE